MSSSYVFSIAGTLNAGDAIEQDEVIGRNADGTWAKLAAGMSALAGFPSTNFATRSTAETVTIWHGKVELVNDSTHPVAAGATIAYLKDGRTVTGDVLYGLTGVPAVYPVEITSSIVSILIWPDVSN